MPLLLLRHKFGMSENNALFWVKKTACLTFWSRKRKEIFPAAPKPFQFISCNVPDTTKTLFIACLTIASNFCPRFLSVGKLNSIHINLHFFLILYIYFLQNRCVGKKNNKKNTSALHKLLAKNNCWGRNNVAIIFVLNKILDYKNIMVNRKFWPTNFFRQTKYLPPPPPKKGLANTFLVKFLIFIPKLDNIN